MTRIIFLFLFIGLVFTACQSDTANNNPTTLTNEESDKTAETETASSSYSPTYERLLKITNGNKETIKIAEVISPLIGSNMVSAINFNKGQVSLKYFESADAYNAQTSKTRKNMDAGSFEQYWKTGSRAEKTFSLAAAEILKKCEFVQSVNVILPTGKETLIGLIDREGLSKITGQPWNVLLSKWDIYYRNGIVRQPAGRAKFIDTFKK